LPVTVNMVEFSRVRATPGMTVSAEPATHIITLSTGASKDDTLDGSLIDEETGHPFVRELEA
jgi:hypothetical protein